MALSRQQSYRSYLAQTNGYRPDCHCDGDLLHLAGVGGELADAGSDGAGGPEAASAVGGCESATAVGGLEGVSAGRTSHRIAGAGALPCPASSLGRSPPPETGLHCQEELVKKSGQNSKVLRSSEKVQRKS